MNMPGTRERGHVEPWPAYLHATYYIRELGRVWGLGTRWRMLSPSWKNTYYIAWQAKTIRGDIVPVTVTHADMSPQYRSERGLFNALLFDFKAGRVQSSLVHDIPFRGAYARYLGRKIEQEQHWTPTHLRLIRKQLGIPKPSEAAAQRWSPMRADFDQKAKRISPWLAYSPALR
jgi:hypothetical protein